MSAGRSFRSLFMAATCAGAALSCYMVSLRVASERAALEDVESQIVMTQRGLRVLQTEIGTRGRLAQLERWNASVLSLSAPGANQFLNGSFELAKLARPDDKTAIDAPVVLASAPAPQPVAPLSTEVATDDAATPAVAPAIQPKAAPAPSRDLSARSLMSEASYKIPSRTETREVPVKPAVANSAKVGATSKGTPVTAAKPVLPRPADKPGLAAAKPAAPSAKNQAPKGATSAANSASKAAPKKTVDKPALATAKPVTKAVALAKADPLAALPNKPKTRPH